MDERPIAAVDDLHPILLAAEASGRTSLLEHEVYALLAEAGITVPRHRYLPAATRVDEGLCAALGSAEAVVKIVSPDVPHKSDVGGVAFCRNDVAAVEQAVAAVTGAAQRAAPTARLEGTLILERVAHEAGLGRELLAGLRHDDAFGAVVIAGVGGLDAEVLQGALRAGRGRAIRQAEGLTEADAVAMLRGTLCHAALVGELRSTRGVTASEGILAELLLALARLAERLAGFAPPAGLGLAELEINPFVLAPSGRLVALDGLARLHRPKPTAPPRPRDGIERLLRPKSAVVVGASSESVNPGRVVLRSLLASEGISRDRLYAVHPKAESIDGVRCMRSLAELPERVDLAVVGVAADRGADRVVLEIQEGRRAHAVTLISAGFGETEGGRVIESRIRKALADGHRGPDGGIVLNGGNCLGIVSLPGAYSTLFLPAYKLPMAEAPADQVAVLSQSGAFLVTLVSDLEGVVRPRYAVSLGNQMDLTVGDYLTHLEADEGTRVFAVYVEGFEPGDGRRFLAASRRLAQQGRPVVFFKAGRTVAGGIAASSHTAATVGDYDVCRSLARAAGVVQCSTLDDMEDLVMTFALLDGRRPSGRRVAVISNAGFECAAAADDLGGLSLAAFAPATWERLRGLLPAGVIDAHNPLDVSPGMTTDGYAACLEAILADPGVDAVLASAVPATPALETLVAGTDHGEDIARSTSLPSRLRRIFHGTAKPVVFCVDAGPRYDALVYGLRRSGLPCFRKIDRAIRGLETFVSFFG